MIEFIAGFLAGGAVCVVACVDPKHGIITAREAWKAGWKAGQAAERERLQPVIDSLQECHEAMEYMSEYDIPIGLPIRVRTALKIVKGEPQ